MKGFIEVEYGDHLMLINVQAISVVKQTDEVTIIRTIESQTDRLTSYQIKEDYASIRAKIEEALI